jgi:hypothetical protein
MTMGGPPAIREKKIDRYHEALDIKLNCYLMKWIVITILYQLEWVFKFLSIFLPAIPAIKLLMTVWIALP